jgi:superfamily I DNA and/or RNA helicase
MQRENEFNRHNNNIPQLEIASIDGFQGREKDYRFISCIRSLQEQGKG